MTEGLRRMDDERLTRLEEKVDAILEKVLQLPCKEGEANHKSLGREVTWIQRILMVFIPMMVGSVGAIYMILLPLDATVNANSAKWMRLEPEHVSLIKDVEVLKEKSAGYRTAVEHGKAGL